MHGRRARWVRVATDSPGVCCSTSSAGLVPLALDPAKPVRDAAVRGAYLAVVRKPEEMTRRKKQGKAEKRPADASGAAAKGAASPKGTTTTARADVALGWLGLGLVGRRGRVRWAGRVGASEAAAGLASAEDADEAPPPPPQKIDDGGDDGATTAGATCRRKSGTEEGVAEARGAQGLPVSHRGRLLRLVGR